MFCVLAHAKSKPGEEDALRSVLMKLIRPSRAEAGVVHYDVFESAGRRGEFTFVEAYVDEVAFEAHKASRHVLVASGRAASLLETELSLDVVDVLSGEEK